MSDDARDLIPANAWSAIAALAVTLCVLLWIFLIQPLTVIPDGTVPNSKYQSSGNDDTDKIRVDQLVKKFEATNDRSICSRFGYSSSQDQGAPLVGVCYITVGGWNAWIASTKTVPDGTRLDQNDPASIELWQSLWEDNEQPAL